jgi:hypothetical protein
MKRRKTTTGIHGLCVGKDLYHVTRLTRQVPLVEQELLILPEHLSSPPFFCGVRVTRSLVVLCVCFEDHYLSFCTFSFFKIQNSATIAAFCLHIQCIWGCKIWQLSKICWTVGLSECQTNELSDYWSVGHTLF